MRLTLIILLAGTGVASAQSVVHEVWGPTQSFGFAEVVEPAGDINLDGTPDYAVTNSTAFLYGLPIVTFHSGDTGAIIGSIQGPSVNVGFGISVAAGRDLDGDAVPDLVIGASLGTPNGQQPPLPYGSVYVYSGAGQQPIRSHFNGITFDKFGFDVAFLDDLNADGVAEYAVRSTFSQQSPNTVDVYSGKTGQWIRQHVALPDYLGHLYGERVVSLGDIDQDGTSDYAIMDPEATQSPGSGSHEGAVILYSGATGTEIRKDWGVGPLSYGGGLEAVGDIDGDSIPDYATAGEAGTTLLVVSGVSGSIITKRVAPANHVFGRSIRVTQDLDGDALPDLLVPEWGITTFETPYAIAVSTISGQTLYKYERPATANPFWPYYPDALVDIGDVDMDGSHEWAIGNIQETDQNTGLGGSVRVVSVRPLYSHPQEVATSTDKVGLEVNAGLSNRNSPYLILASKTGTSGIPFGGQNIPLTYDLLTEYSLLGYNTVIFGNTLGVTDGFGQASAFFDRTYVPTFMQNDVFWFATIGLGPGGHFVSNAEKVAATGAGTGG